MKIGSYEIRNKNIMQMSKVLDDLYEVCADIHHEKESYTFEELCSVQMLLWDIYESTIQRFRSDDWRLNLKSGAELWKNEDDIFDLLKRKVKNHSK